MHKYLKYTVDNYSNCISNNSFADAKDQEWFVSQIKYYQDLLCKAKIYIELSAKFYDHLKKSKTALTVVFLEVFCKALTFIVYKLFGKSNNNNLLKFKNKLFSLYNKKALNFKVELSFTSKELETIEQTLKIRQTVFGHSDDYSYDFEKIDSLMRSVNISDVAHIIEKSANFVSYLWENFCNQKMCFDLKALDNMSKTLNSICKII